MRRPVCFCVFCFVVAAILILLSLSVQRASAADAPVSFVRDVAPIVKERCLACHDSKKRAGKLDMTTFEKLFAGGTNGEPIVPGKPEESDFHTLMVTKDDRRMPPRDKGEAVPRDKADVIARWIKEGAKLDAGINPKADLIRELRTRWTPPQPPAKYKFPAVVNALAFTPDGSKLVVGGHHELTVWDAKDGKLLSRLRTRTERAYAMLFLKDGTLAVAGGRPGQEGDVRVYKLEAKPAETKDGVAMLDGVNDPAVKVAHLFDTDDSVICLALSPTASNSRPADATARSAFGTSQKEPRRPSWSSRLRITPTGCSASPFRRTARS